MFTLYVILGLFFSSVLVPSSVQSSSTEGEHHPVASENINATRSWILNAYPPTHRSNHVDVYKSEARGEVYVHDPYQWLEHDTPERDEWISAQENFTESYIDQYPERQKLREAIRANMNYPKCGSPGYHGNHWYWFYNTGLQAQSVLYKSDNATLPNLSTNGPSGHIFFDPNLLTTDGTAAFHAWEFSHCGRYFAYGISQSGSDFFTIYVRRTDVPFAAVNGKRPSHDEGRFPDELRFCKFSSITWTHDSKGFFYQRFPEQAERPEGVDRDAMLYYHRLNTSQAEDILVYKDATKPEWTWDTKITQTDGRYLVLSITKDTSDRNLLWIADLHNNKIGPNMKWEKVVDRFEGQYKVIANDGTRFYIRTNYGAPLRHLITIDLADPKREHRVAIPEDKNAFLSRIKAVDYDKFVVVYNRAVIDEVYVYSMNGTKLTRLAPHFIGAARISARRDESWFFVKMEGFTSPNTIGFYNFTKSENKRWKIYWSSPVKSLKASDFETSQVRYTSKDGTRIPMFIVRHKSARLSGTAPVLQYGYGGFAVAVKPFFNTVMLTFLQKYGGILAVPNIRGGSEFGEQWHQAGVRERKVNSFDDFIAATQYLVKNKYAAPGKVVITGASNGGLLVAACVNRAAQGTFGAAVAEVGVMDLLKFPDFTTGKAWISEYGDPRDPHDFDFIYPVSPLHNVPKDRVLPPTILLTADHDDRVVPLHSFKHIATLQHALPHNPNPLLIRIEKKAGHGDDKSTEQKIGEGADKWSFVARSMGLIWQD